LVVVHFSPVACHLALAAPAFGETAKRLHKMFEDTDTFESQLVLTKMADPTSNLMTNEDVERYVLDVLLRDLNVKVVVMNAAICDFEMENPSDQARLSSSQDYQVTLKGIKGKILSLISKNRPDIVLAGFKTTCGATKVEQVAKAFASMYASKLDIVLANDLETRENILVTSDLRVDHGQSRHYMLQRLVEESVKAYRVAAWRS
jgi:hypothetical protein